MRLTTFWPLSQKTNIGHLRNEARRFLEEFFVFSVSRLKSPMTSGQIVGKMMDHQKLLNVPLQAARRSVEEQEARAADEKRRKRLERKAEGVGRGDWCCVQGVSGTPI